MTPVGREKSVLIREVSCTRQLGDFGGRCVLIREVLSSGRWPLSVSMHVIYCALLWRYMYVLGKVVQYRDCYCGDRQMYSKWHPVHKMQGRVCENFSFYPFGPRRTKVIDVSCIGTVVYLQEDLSKIAWLLTLLSIPLLTSSKKWCVHINILSLCRLNRTYSCVFRVNLSNTVVYRSKCANIRILHQNPRTAHACTCSFDCSCS